MSMFVKNRTTIYLINNWPNDVSYFIWQLGIWTDFRPLWVIFMDFFGSCMYNLNKKLNHIIVLECLYSTSR